jgi:hypothetical protein
MEAKEGRGRVYDFILWVKRLKFKEINLICASSSR